MQKIHVHNDFDVHLNFTNISTDYISRVEFWTRRDDVFCCCKCDGSLKVEDENNIVCYLNDHNLGTGKLNYNVIFQIPDSNYNDGYKKVCQHYVSDIFLTNENGDTTVAIVKVLGDEKVTDLINRLGEFEKVFDNKQDKLAFDNTPTSGSKNVVYSDGIYNAIKNNKPDLSDYAKKTDLQGLATEQWVTDKGYLTEHQSLDSYVTKTELDSKGYLTEHQSLTDYAKKTDLEGFATEQWVNNQGYLTSIPDDYAKKSDIPNTSIETVTVSPSEDTEYTLNSNKYLRVIPAAAVKLTFNMPDGTGLMREYHILIDCKTAEPTIEFNGVIMWELNNDPVFEKGRLYDIIIRNDGYNLYGSWKAYKLMAILITTSDAAAVQLNGTTYKLTAGDNSLKDGDLNTITKIVGFEDNDNITSIDFDDSIIKIEDLSAKFSYMGNLTKISNIIVKYAKSLKEMFRRSRSLKEIDTSYWDVSNVTNFTSMFWGCNSLTSLDLSGWNVSRATNFSYMFSGCRSLKTIDVSNWDVGGSISSSSSTDFSSMFRECTSLKTLDLSGWNMSKAGNFTAMFSGCRSLKTLDAPNLNLYGVVSMFETCNKLTTLDVSNWNVSNVTDFTNMFYDCNALTTLDVSNWNVSRAKIFYNMFYGCSGLTSLDLSSWNVSSAVNFNSMFFGCRSLISLNMSGWNTSSVTDFSYMFNGCSSLTSLDVSNWDTSKATNFNSMFRGCKSLTTLDLSGWDMSASANVTDMFDSCNSLTTIKMIGCSQATIDKIKSVKPASATIITE